MVDEFDFEDDGIKEETSIVKSSDSVCSSISYKNRKKRHRLNYGSSKLTGRSNLAAVKDDENIGDAVRNQNSSMASRSTDEEVIASQQNLNSRRPIARRRKRNLVLKKKKHIGAQYFSSSSVSPSSFLSSVKSSNATVRSLSSKDELRKNDTFDVVGMKNEGEEKDERRNFGTPPCSPPQMFDKIHIREKGSPKPPSTGTIRRQQKRSKAERIQNDESSKNSRDTKTTSTPDSPCRKKVHMDKETINQPDESVSVPPSPIPTQSHSCNNSVASDISLSLRTNLVLRRRKSHQNENAYFDPGNDMKSPQSSHGNSSVISNESEKIITGAGTDVYAVQDAGSHRLVLDDCNYLCSSFLSGIGVDKEEKRSHNTITADASCDLAVMLSSKNTRGVLANVRYGISMSENQADADSNVFDTVLNVIGQVPSSICGSYLPSTVFCDDRKNHKEIDKRYDWNNIIAKDDEEDANEELVGEEANKTRCKSRRIRTKGYQGNGRNNTSLSIGSGYDTVVTNALALSAHFLSLDCTLNKRFSSANTPATAKSWRRQILQHKDVLRGISRLLLADHIVASILECKNPGRKPIAFENDKPNLNSTIEVSADPTSRGRRNKRKRKRFDATSSNSTGLETVDEHEKQMNSGLPIASKEIHHGINGDAGGFDFISDEASSNSDKKSIDSAFSTERLPSRFKRKLSVVQSKLFMLGSEKSDKHSKVSKTFCAYCMSEKKREMNPGNIALSTLHRILSGKFNDDDEGLEEPEEVPEFDDDTHDHTSRCNEKQTNCTVDDVEQSNLSNPMIYSNFVFRKRGGIPYLARAMVETLEAAKISITSDKNDDEKCCDSCIQYLRDKILQLSALVDSLCCMSRENRKLFCLISIESNGITVPILVPSLVKIFAHFSTNMLDQTQPAFADIILATLRTLTSLTHENDVASAQLVSHYNLGTVLGLPDNTTQGVEILLRILYYFTEKHKDIRELAGTQNHLYDSAIFCLNTLTNVLESSSFKVAIMTVLDMKIEQSNGLSLPALTWLTRWIVEQTKPFRDVIMSENFGKKNSSTRHLEHHEDEYLVMAGNGFILLSCFLGASPDKALSDNQTKDRIKETVLVELIQNDNGNKMIMVINTLKAFCNFYRFSIGELSVAVIAPVLNLISGLENLSL